MNLINQIENDINSYKNDQEAIKSQRYFKTDKGEYGEGDIFLGLSLTQIKLLNKKYKDINLETSLHFLKSPIHEYRTFALSVICNQFIKSKDNEFKNKIFQTYLENTKYINNWDLVDMSAPIIVGDVILNMSEKERKEFLKELSESKSLWERRIAIVSTHKLIKNNILDDTLYVSDILINELKDKEDLIHKACGWMLREVGKRNQEMLEKYITKNILIIPRTTLRYSIEKFDEEKRKYYLKLK